MELKEPSTEERRKYGNLRLRKLFGMVSSQMFWENFKTVLETKGPKIEFSYQFFLFFPIHVNNVFVICFH